MKVDSTKKINKKVVTVGPKKRSLTVNGHSTSVSIEDPFWHFLANLAQKQDKAVNELVSEIDIQREPNVGLATSVRIYCLEKALQSSLI